MHVEEIARQVVDGAYKVHTALGPGLLESAYQTCLAHELRKRGLTVETEVVMPVIYDGVHIDAGYRLDMRVEHVILIENKAVERVLPIHHAQLMTYLKLTGCTLGFLINFNVKMLRDGLQRVVHHHPTGPLQRTP
jgi:GxxExxY protein